MTSRPIHLLILTAGLLSCLLLLVASADIDGVEADNVTASPAATSDTYNLPQAVKSVPILEGLSWAGEPMPLNPDTRERLDRELSVNAYWQSSTLLNLKSANKYFPTIERVLAEEGVPDDFKYLAVAESNLRNVTSSASAKGYWQFRSAAAKEWGLEVNSEVDERYHLERSTRAAARYLKHMYKRFGSWANASAAYNVGPTRYASLLRDQGEDSYYDLHLNSETARYVFRLIAMKEIMQNPSGFGFEVQPSELYPPTDTYQVEVNSSVTDWPSWSSAHGVSYRMLKFYNPWLIDSKLTVKNNTYHVELPRG